MNVRWTSVYILYCLTFIAVAAAFAVDQLDALETLEIYSECMVQPVTYLSAWLRPFVLNLLRCVSSASLRNFKLGSFSFIVPDLDVPDLDWRVVDAELGRFSSLVSVQIHVRDSLFGPLGPNGLSRRAHGTGNNFFPLARANGLFELVHV